MLLGCELANMRGETGEARKLKSESQPLMPIIALAVGTIAACNQPGLHKTGQMAPHWTGRRSASQDLRAGCRDGSCEVPKAQQNHSPKESRVLVTARSRNTSDLSTNRRAGAGHLPGELAMLRGFHGCLIYPRHGTLRRVDWKPTHRKALSLLLMLQSSQVRHSRPRTRRAHSLGGAIPRRPGRPVCSRPITLALRRTAQYCHHNPRKDSTSTAQMSGKAIRRDRSNGSPKTCTA